MGTLLGMKKRTENTSNSSMIRKESTGMPKRQETTTRRSRIDPKESEPVSKACQANPRRITSVWSAFLKRGKKRNRIPRHQDVIHPRTNHTRRLLPNGEIGTHPFEPVLDEAGAPLEVVVVITVLLENVTVSVTTGMLVLVGVVLVLVVVLEEEVVVEDVVVEVVVLEEIEDEEDEVLVVLGEEEVVDVVVVVDVVGVAGVDVLLDEKRDDRFCSVSFLTNES